MPALATKCPAIGPRDAKVLIVGEAPGEKEIYQRKNGVLKPEPFVGRSGKLLDTVLAGVGLNRSECFITNACKYRPPNNKISEWIYTKTKAKENGIPEYLGRYVHPNIVAGVYELEQEILDVKPNLVIALGDLALWATTGNTGIMKWRGSTLLSRCFSPDGPLTKVIPTYHPAAVMRNYPWKMYLTHDMQNCAEESLFPERRKPDYNFILRPSYEEVVETLGWLKTMLDRGNEVRLAVDIETRQGHIACIAIAWSRLDAICIPLMTTKNITGYWGTGGIENAVVNAIRGVTCHPNAEIVGQNYLYDEQYMLHHWMMKSNTFMDTMVAHHVCWPGTLKGLHVLSSLYCKYHEYWKDEGKEWDTSMPEEQYWGYNCKDAVVTYEISYVLERQVKSLGLEEQYAFQMETYDCVLDAMLRGVRVDKAKRSEFGLDLNYAADQYECWFKKIITPNIHTPPKSKTAKPWYRSPIQQATLFYDELGIKEVKNYSTGRRTCDDDALLKIGKREPILKPITDAMANYRSIGVVYSNCIKASLDPDGRARCTYKVPGTDTFRLASAKNAFDRGMNHQNITSGEEEGESQFPIPNIREMMIPDIGYTMYAPDLSKADLYVVVWEAEDKELRQMLKEGVDLHVENAKTIFGGNPKPSKLAASPYHKAKQGVHATNYGCRARTLGSELGITVHEAERFISRWLAAHPGIERWHKRVDRSLQETRSVSNKFGFRIRYFDRVDTLLPEALAWIPQSTVALVINKAWHNIRKNLPHVQVLMQVHDELVMQVPNKFDTSVCRLIIKEHMTITVPYDDPLIIPIELSASRQSWGQCKDRAWD